MPLSRSEKVRGEDAADVEAVEGAGGGRRLILKREGERGGKRELES